MNGDEVLKVLREIRDETKQTNVRLGSLEGRVEQTNVRLESLEGRVEQTNVRLESLEGRVEFLEKKTSKGFETLAETLNGHNERLDAVARQQAESELRLASEVLALADVTREVRDLLSRKLDDHKQVVEHEQRIRALEDRVADR